MSMKLESEVCYRPILARTKSQASLLPPARPHPSHLPRISSNAVVFGNLINYSTSRGNFSDPCVNAGSLIKFQQVFTGLSLKTPASYGDHAVIDDRSCDVFTEHENVRTA
jgi:hypothetical protein